MVQSLGGACRTAELLDEGQNVRWCCILVNEVQLPSRGSVQNNRYQRGWKMAVPETYPKNGNANGEWRAQSVSGELSIKTGKPVVGIFSSNDSGCLHT